MKKNHIIYIPYITLIMLLSGSVYGQDSTLYRFQNQYNNYALLIGINDYADDYIMDLEFAHNDVLSIRDMLTEKFDFLPDQIRTLLDQDATLQNIRNAITEFYSKGENTRVFVYFAGHGETVKLNNSQEMGFLVPYDGDLSSESTIHKTCLPMSEMGGFSQYLPSRNILYMIDACYGGLAAMNPRSGAEYGVSFIDKMMSSKSRQIITAGGKNERVVERSSLQHSVFTKVLLDGLKNRLADLDNDGIIPASELYVYLKKQVSAYTYNMQTPIMRYFTPDEGEFVFILPPKNANTETGNLTVKSNLKDAMILINDRETPFKIGANIPALQTGRNKITLKHNAHRMDKEVHILPGDNLISMEYQSYPVQLSANVDGAKLSIDGVPTESLNFKNLSLVEGLHKITLEKQGWRIDTTILIISDAQNNIELEFPVGSLKINSTPRGAVYTIGNTSLKDDSTVIFTNLLPGIYTITASKGSTAFSKTIEIKPGFQQETNFEELFKREKKKKWWYLAGGAVAAAALTIALLNSSSDSGSSGIKPPNDFFPTE